MTNGMKTNGGAISGFEHLKQSIVDILTTPKGTRVMRRDYGSDLFALLDGPVSPDRLVDFHAAVAEALDRWEPRFKLRRVDIVNATPGHVVLDLTGLYQGRVVTLEGLVA